MSKKTNMTGIKPGAIFSEASFYVVKQVNPDSVVFSTEIGIDVTLGNPYVEQLLQSADFFQSEEKKTKTELAEILINNSNVVMTVSYYKADKTKGVREFAAEKAAKIAEIQNARVADVPTLLGELIDNPITKTIPGELRVMKGRHHGNVDDLGRVHFVDMEQAKGTGAHDARLRQIDPRTIQYIILRGVKYSLK